MVLQIKPLYYHGKCTENLFVKLERWKDYVRNSEMGERPKQRKREAEQVCVCLCYMCVLRSRGETLKRGFSRAH